MEEVWKNLSFINFSNYDVSNKGNLKNIKTGHVYFIRPTHLGYVRVTLVDDLGRGYKKMIHILVALAFIPNTENKPTVNHKDKNRSNNDINNLEWSTSSEQNKHKGANSKRDGIPIYKLNDNLEIIEKFDKATIAEEKYGYNRSNIAKACINKKKYNGFYWRYSFDIDIIVDEIWKPINLNTDGQYYASNYGRIKTPRGIIKSGYDSGGYLVTELKFSDGKTKAKGIHILVASAFLPPDPNRPLVNHKDGNKHNNKLENIEYVNQSENVNHAYDNGLISPNLNNNKSTKVIQFSINNEQIKIFNTLQEAEEITGVGRRGIGNVCRGVAKSAGGFIWKYADKD